MGIYELCLLKSIIGLTDIIDYTGGGGGDFFFFSFDHVCCRSFTNSEMYYGICSFGT